jgi:squalene-associated FAD-dependent desaturase
MTRHVVVVGGGLAGLSAALRCADAGARVTLLEGRPRLGGATTSFARGEVEVDNGQHVFMRCCTSYLGFLARLGVTDLVRLQERMDVPVIDVVGGRTLRLRRNRLPAPLQLGGSVLTYSVLSPRQRLRLGRAVLALRRLDRTTAAADAISFGDWLRAHGQDAHTITSVWDLIGVATLNARADDASLALAATVFQVGLLTHGPAADLGWSRVPLHRLHAEPAARALALLGAEVRTGAKVEQLEPSAGGWRVSVRDAEQLTADAVVLAVPPSAAERLLPPGSTSLPDGWSDRLGAAPIVNAHVTYDRRVLDQPFTAVLGTAVPWIFDATEPTGTKEGQALAIPISAAQELVALPVAEVRRRVEEALALAVPATRTAVVRDFFVTRERAATFRPAPGSGALRPGAQTRCPGLFLAGAWTDTGWPATMEGAVRSGDKAADAVGTYLQRSRVLPAATDAVPA